MSAEKQSFIDKYKGSAIAACAGTGLFPSVMIAQALIESGFGKSQLASQYNNFFGIKADSGWKGEKVWLKNGKGDPNAYSYYRVYSSPEESFADRVRFLQVNPTYTKHGVFAATNPQEQIQAMKNAGYAEAANYVSTIMGEINYYGLNALDNIQTVVSTTPILAKASKTGYKILGGIGVLIALICLYQLGVYYYPQFSISQLWKSKS